MFSGGRGKYILNRMGESTPPCGTPWRTFLYLNFDPHCKGSPHDTKHLFNCTSNQTNLTTRSLWDQSCQAAKQPSTWACLEMTLMKKKKQPEGYNNNRIWVARKSFCELPIQYDGFMVDSSSLPLWSDKRIFICVLIFLFFGIPEFC